MRVPPAVGALCGAAALLLLRIPVSPGPIELKPHAFAFEPVQLVSLAHPGLALTLGFVLGGPNGNPVPVRRIKIGVPPRHGKLATDAEAVRYASEAGAADRFELNLFRDAEDDPVQVVVAVEPGGR
jgi:hypothetical protein